mmetsp:Transcript_65200/g.172763  ORF Transcript_65200/g.172763 Transcript_65200/m.172763 type:complete len:231 (-) Transcript_65200:454-1146(-)
MTTLHTRLNTEPGKRSSPILRPVTVRFPLTSSTTKFRAATGANCSTILATLRSSICGRPKKASGRSLLVVPEYPRCRASPLFVAHETIIRSLNSVYFRFSFKKVSNQSKVPSSGRPTGYSTSGFSTGDVDWTLQSDSAASCRVRHLNGNGRIGTGPKCTCTVTFLYVTAGYSGFPLIEVGRTCGSPARTPLTKRLTVFEFGDCPSRLRTTASTVPGSILPVTDLSSWSWR